MDPLRYLDTFINWNLDSFCHEISLEITECWFQAQHLSFIWLMFHSETDAFSKRLTDCIVAGADYHIYEWARTELMPDVVSGSGKFILICRSFGVFMKAWYFSTIVLVIFN